MREKKLKNNKLWILIVLAVIIVGAVSVLVGINMASGAVDPQNNDKITIAVVDGDTTDSIAGKLKENDLIKSEFVFKLKAKMSGNDGNFKKGVYSIQQSMTTAEIIEMIASGDTDMVSFTIPEGYDTRQIMDRLVEAGLVTENEFIDEVRNGEFDYDFLESSPDDDSRLEGYLYPNTYFVYADSSAHDIIDKMLSTFDSLITDEHYKKAKELDMSIRDIVTIASLIERETKATDERTKVASVIYNRLDKNMKLQMCASVQYSLDEPKENLLYSDLTVDSPYNTYIYAGLPYGPLCSPRIECIEAALNPANTDYIYFVLAPELDGRHNFSATYKEFEKNKKAYKEAIAKRDNEADD